MGGDAARSSRRNADVIFTSLPEPARRGGGRARADGLIAGMKPGAAFFDLSTNSPGMVKKLHAAFAARARICSTRR